MTAAQAALDAKLETIPANVPINTMNDPAFQRAFALLIASGVSMASIAQRTGRTITQLNYLRICPGVEELIQQAISEASPGETATKMVRGSVVDSVLTIINIRDNPMQFPTQVQRLRFDASRYLVDRHFGPQKGGLGSLLQDDHLTAELKRGGDYGAAILNDIIRLAETDPAAKVALENAGGRKPSPDTPETKRQGFAGVSPPPAGASSGYGVPKVSG